MKKFFITSFLITVLIGGAFFIYRKWDNHVIQEPIPSAQVYPHTITNEGKMSEGGSSFGVGVYQSPAPTATPKIFPVQSDLQPTAYSLSAELNLAVPFTVQAPNANWDEIHQEFCEEASILMAASYIKGWSTPNTETADKKMFEIKSFEEKRFGYYKDTTAEEMAIILKEFYGIEKVKVIYDPTVDVIKRVLSEKKVIIAPAAGRQLGNPYYRRPGPLYHALVIKGYTKEGNFITNDPGTRRGANFIYSPDTLMNAIHDWNGGDVDNGRKVVVIVG